MKRSRSRAAAWWMLVALLVSHLAAAAYACPLYERLVGPASHASETGAPCGDVRLDAADPLCFQHCTGGADRSPQFGADHPVSAPIAEASPSAVADTIRERHRLFEPFLTRATAPPIFASSARLRI